MISFGSRRKEIFALIEAGDRYRDKETKKMYVVKAVDGGEVLLVGENGQGRRLTNIKGLEHPCDKLEDKGDKSS